jgi:hypothetical protein
MLDREIIRKENEISGIASQGILQAQLYLDKRETKKALDTLESKNLSIFNLDEILKKFESLDAISKLAFSMLFSSSVIF